MWDGVTEIPSLMEFLSYKELLKRPDEVTAFIECCKNLNDKCPPPFWLPLTSFTAFKDTPKRKEEINEDTNTLFPYEINFALLCPPILHCIIKQQHKFNEIIDCSFSNLVEFCLREYGSLEQSNSMHEDGTFTKKYQKNHRTEPLWAINQPWKDYFDRDSNEIVKVVTKEKITTCCLELILSIFETSYGQLFTW